MLTRLTARNFKRFGQAEIELANPVVLIGPNKGPPQDKSRGVASGVWSCRLLLRGCSSTR